MPEKSLAAKTAKERLLTNSYEIAKTSVGLPVGPHSDAVSMVRLGLGEGRGLIAPRNQIEHRAVELLQDLPDYQLPTSVPGIGPINALTIPAETGDLRCFNHHRQFLKFCGMDLATMQSGTFVAKPSCQNTGMPACAAPCGWPVRSPLCSGPTAFATSSSAPSPSTATTPICAEKRIPQSPLPSLDFPAQCIAGRCSPPYVFFPLTCRRMAKPCAKRAITGLFSHTDPSGRINPGHALSHQNFNPP